MAIIKKQGSETTELSSSKKVGKANSKDIKKRQNIKLGVTDGVALQLNKEGKAVAPAVKKKKEQKKIADMIKKAKN